MNNKELISSFVNGAVTGKGSNLIIVGKELVNYSTTIAFRADDTIYLNAQKYSPTTSKNQTYVRREVDYSNKKLIEVDTEQEFKKNTGVI